MRYTPQKYWQDRGQNYSVSADTNDEIDNLTNLVKTYVRNGDTILEIGPGYGRVYQHLVKNRIPAEKFTLCDFVESMRRKCELLTDVLPDPWDGKTLPYPNNSFDFVISFSVMLHVPRRDFINHWAENVRVARRFLYVATYDGPREGLAQHCFTHRYRDFISAFGLRVVDERPFKNGTRVNWLLEKVI